MKSPCLTFQALRLYRKNRQSCPDEVPCENLKEKDLTDFILRVHFILQLLLFNRTRENRDTMKLMIIVMI